MNRTLADIKSDLLRNDTSLSVILRKVRVIATALDNSELLTWIHKEQNGYEWGVDKVPDFRRIKIESWGDFRTPVFKQTVKLAIPVTSLPSSLQEYATEHTFVEPISELESISQGDRDDLVINWAADLLPHLTNKVVNSGECIHAYKPLTKARVVGVVEAAKNRLLDFVLALEELFPPNQAVEQMVTSDIQDKAQIIIEQLFIGGSNPSVFLSGSGPQTVQKGGINTASPTVTNQTLIGTGNNVAKNRHKPFLSYVWDWIKRLWS